jgi:hypothetical protein
LINFKTKEDFLNYHGKLVELATVLVRNTNIEELSKKERASVLQEYYFENTLNIRNFDSKPPKSSRSNCQSSGTGCDNCSYHACENDVSASLAGNLLECAVAIAVTGIGTGGIGGIIIGAACVGNALYQATLASNACVINHC